MLDGGFLVDGPTSTKNAECKAKGGVPSTCHPRGTPHLPGAACRGCWASSNVCRGRREGGEEYLDRQPRAHCCRAECRRFVSRFAGGSAFLDLLRAARTSSIPAVTIGADCGRHPADPIRGGSGTERRSAKAISTNLNGRDLQPLRLGLGCAMVERAAQAMSRDLQ